MAIDQVIKTWDGNNINDGTNYFSSFEVLPHGLPPAAVVQAQRSGRQPLVAAVIRPGDVIVLKTIIEDLSSAASLRAQLRQWFDNDDETPKQMVIDGDAGVEQYIYGVVESHEPVPGQSAVVFITAIRVHDDAAWRKTSATTPSNWGITASGDTNTYNNAGELDVYPTYSITPTSAKTGTNPYKRFMSVRWGGDAATSYPTDIAAASLDTRVSPTTNFASATGDDIRVYVDGVLTDFWLAGINTTTTKIWVNLNFQKAQGSNITASFGTGTVESIDVEDDISGWPDAGMMQIGNEIFIYSSKNNSLKRFFIESRAAKGSTAASHTAGDFARWIQHDIVVTYGSASLSAYTVDDDYKPVFSLTSSTNTSWVYTEFGEDDGLRTGAWQKGREYSDWAVSYTADSGSDVPDGWSDADPWEELGIFRNRVDTYIDPSFFIYNPCGISSANFSNGEKYAATSETQWNGKVKSGISTPGDFTESSLTKPTLPATWQSWGFSGSLRSGSKYVGISLSPTQGGGGTGMYMECADVTLTLNSTFTPNVTIVAEDGNYNLAATLTNNDTEEAIEISFQMDVNETLTIDTTNGTVTYEKDGSSQYAAITRVGGPRVAWLRLQPGNNELQFDDTGTAGVTVAVSYEERRGA